MIFAQFAYRVAQKPQSVLRAQSNLATRCARQNTSASAAARNLIARVVIMIKGSRFVTCAAQNLACSANRPIFDRVTHAKIRRARLAAKSAVTVTNMYVCAASTITSAHQKMCSSATSVQVKAPEYDIVCYANAGFACAYHARKMRSGATSAKKPVVPTRALKISLSSAAPARKTFASSA